MGSAYKPETYNSVSPYLIVNDADATINFLKQVFDAQELRRIPTDDEKILHAEVRIDDSVLMLADSQDGWERIPSNVHIYVQDVDAIYQKALSVGASSVKAPIQEDDDDKRGGIQDASGITWWIATTVS